ncbi:MAG: putative membrane protein YfcA [Glaciecola sp.]|jgi:uncharacterized membrane protein YfcA
MLFRTGKSALCQKWPDKAGQEVRSTFISFFSSMVGIGSGTISVPLLILHSYPTHKAVGTAVAVGLIISLPAALTMLTLRSIPSDTPASRFGLVNLFGFLCILPLTAFFAMLGVSLAEKLNTV